MNTLSVQSNSSNPGKQPIIPWLWFWLIVYIINIPQLLSGIWEDYLKDLLGSPFSSLENAANPLAKYTVWSNLVEVSAFVIVLLGVFAILFPRARAFLFEKNLNLKPLDPATTTPSVQEIRTFILDHLPQSHISVNLSMFNQYATTYPLGYRTSAIAVFGGLVLLWKKDRRAAEAILLHEIAHCKQGDVLIVGAGSLLQWLLERWYLLLLGLLPIPIAEAYDIFSSWSEFGGLRWGMWFNNSEIGNFLRTNLSNYLFGDLGILVSVVAHIIWVIVLPVVGVWISEFSADRYMAENTQSSDDIVRVFQFVRNKKNSLWSNLLAGLSHPPTGLRAWFAKNHEKPITWILPVLAFPLAYVAKVFLYLIRAASAGWTPDRSWDSIDLLLKKTFISYWNSLIPLWLTMAAVVLLWPLIARYWDWFFNNQNQPANWSNYRQNLISAGVISCLALASVGMSSSIYIPPEPPEPKAEFTPGQHFQVGDVIHATGLDVTVLGWQEVSTDNAVFASQPGNRYVAVELTVTNTCEEAKSTAALSQMKLQDGSGGKYELSVNVNLILNAETPDGRIAPGETLRGVVGYEIPQDASGLAFIFIDDVLDESKHFLVDLGSQPLTVEAPTSGASTEVEVHQIQEPVRIGDLVLTIEKVESLSQNEAFQPDGGNGYLAVDVSLENKSRKTVEFSATSQMEVKDENGVAYGIDFHATALAGEQTTNFIVAPGETAHQRLGYQVPLTAQKLFFAFSFNRDKVLVQLPIPSWPEYTVAPTPSDPPEEVDLTYQVPEEWIKSRQEAGLPALIGDATEDWLLLGEECASGVEESCEMDKVFLDVAIPMPTSQTTP